MKENIVSELCKLVQLDIDAVHAYNQALKNITDDEIHRNISQFRDDHVRHINDLNKEIVRLGEEPPKMTQDFKGYIIEGFTSLRSITGTKGALKAMESNEVLTNSTYKKSLEIEGLTEEIRQLLQLNYADEQKHLDYIRMVLRAMENE